MKKNQYFNKIIFLIEQISFFQTFLLKINSRKISSLLPLISIVLTSFVTNNFSDFIAAPCQTRANDLKIGKTTLYSCGSTSCPTTVATAAPILTKENLTVDGYLIYLTGDGKIYKTNLRQFSPTTIPNVTDANGEKLPTISDDGNWIIYNGANIINKSGVGKKAIARNGAGACTWYRQSPLGKEYAWVENINNKINVYAQAITISENSATPTGTIRTIAQGVDLWDAFFSVGGNSIIAQRFLGNVNLLGYTGRLYGGTLITIPSNGTGTADTTNQTAPVDQCPAMCGMSISPDGKLIATNLGHCYQDCFPENHKGLAIIPSKKYVGAAQNWITSDGVKILWCPKEFEGQNLWAGGVTANDFQHWNWTNNMDYVVGMHFGYQTAIKGAWLVHIPTNTWTLLTSSTTNVLRAAVYITSTSSSILNHIPHKAIKANSLNYWNNLLGKKQINPLKSRNKLIKR